MASNGGIWAALNSPQYAPSVAPDRNVVSEGCPPDRDTRRYGPGVVDQGQALWPGGQSFYADAQDITGYEFDQDPPVDPAFQVLEYYGEVGQVTHPLPAMPGLPMRITGVPPGQASPVSYNPRLSAFRNQDNIGPLQQRRRVPSSTVAVPDQELLAGFPLGGRRPFYPQLGRVTRWPTAQMVYRPMGKES